MSQAFDQPRLNQIAGNKLTELGTPSTVGEDGRLHAELPLERYHVMNPFTGKPLITSRFAVESHDWLRFTSPPLLAALAPIQYFQLTDWAPLVEHVQKLLDYRKKSVDRLATHLHHFQLDARIDVEHGAVVAAVTLQDGSGSVVLIGDEQGVRASHLRPRDGGPNQPLPAAPIELAEFADARDLERFLAKLAQHAHQLADDFSAPKTGEYRPAPGFEATQADAPAPVPLDDASGATREPENTEWMPSTGAFEGAGPGAATGAGAATAITADMLTRCFGDSAQIAQGVAVMRTWQVAGQRIKLTLKQKRGRRFVGRLTGADDATLWSGELDVDKHPPMDEFVYHLLQARGLDVSSLPTPKNAAPAPAPVAAPVRLPQPGSETQVMPIAPGRPPTGGETEVMTVSPGRPPTPPPAMGEPGGEPLPGPGQMWMMKVIVEKSDADEVRYSALNAEGQPYGAARILPRVNFEGVFSEHGGAWRLLVRVLAASPQQVAYVQLDPTFQPSGETRSIAPAIFLANFLPDADTP